MLATVALSVVEREWLEAVTEEVGLVAQRLPRLNVDMNTRARVPSSHTIVNSFYLLCRFSCYTVARSNLISLFRDMIKVVLLEPPPAPSPLQLQRSPPNFHDCLERP